MMEVSTALNTSETEMQASLLPPAHVKVKSSLPHSVRLTADETICNTTRVDASMCRVRGAPEPSILQDSPEFSRLECLDATLTERQGEGTNFSFTFNVEVNVCMFLYIF